MLRMFAKRLTAMLLTMLAVSFTLFLLLESNPDGVARSAIGQFSTTAQRVAWLARENFYVSVPEEEISRYDGYVFFPVNDDRYLIVQPPPSGVVYANTSVGKMTNEEASLLVPLEVPLGERYLAWLSRVVVGDFGYSYRFKTSVSNVLWPRLYETSKLMGLVILLMVPLSLLLGILAGMKEGSWQDRIFSFLAIITTSVPEFASAAFFVAIFVFWLGWLPGTSSMIDGFRWAEIILPALVVTLYTVGYLARITRASMIKVMGSPFVRTAVLKGLSYNRVILRHALRNAIISPVTAIILQIPWLLSGVIVVEYFFAYKGFGALLLEAINNTDIFLIEACAMVSVFVVIVSQLLMDVIYAWINPRLRL